MRPSLRTLIASAVALGILAGAAIAAAASSEPTPIAALPGSETTGRSVPGDLGGNAGGNSGPYVPPPSGACGEQIVGGAPQDGTVSYTPCNDQPVDQGPHATSVLPRPGMTNVAPIAWIKGDVADDGTTVTLRFWSGVEPCYVLDHVDVRYEAGSVIITLFQGSDPSGGDVACIDIAELKQTVVALDQPIAGRPIVDGARI